MLKGEPKVIKVEIKSSLDNTLQPNIIQIPSNYNPEVPKPLVVGLHTWAGDYQQQLEPMGKEAEKRGLILLLPNFRGPNTLKNPEYKKACASEYAQQDIIDAINYVLSNYNINKKRIYLIGASGGGHMALIMAGKYPEIWAAVSAWCAITDLKKWWKEQEKYRKDIEAICGGVPGENDQVDKEYFKRSPINFIENAKDVNLDIKHGKYDEIVPYHHSEDAYKKLIEAGSKKAKLTIFDGGHTIDLKSAFDWVSQFSK